MRCLVERENKAIFYQVCIMCQVDQPLAYMGITGPVTGFEFLFSAVVFLRIHILLIYSFLDYFERRRRKYTYF